jgi:hypothetical protein
MASNPSDSVFHDFIQRYGPPAGEEGPILLVREVFGADPDEWQEEVLRAYGRGERRISIRSCHGPGKTAVAAWCAAHQLLTRYPQKTACTAPTGGQLYDALFAEIKKWLKRAPPALTDLFDMKAERIELKAAIEESFLTARTARPEKPEALQGIHSDWVLLIVDEASGVPEQIFEAAAGSMSGKNATTLLLSNPVRTSGLFFDTHHRLKHEWMTMHVSHKDSERVSEAFVKEIASRYGENSNAFRIRCLGEFPRSDQDTVIPFELVESAMKRDVRPVMTAPMVWGVDVARFGDDRTALCKRRGNTVVEPPQSWRNLDTMQVCGRIKHEYDTAGSDRPVEILVDVIGLGAGVADRLREMGLPARGINVSELPALGGNYLNLRADLWWRAREWFAKRDCLLPDDSTEEEPLSAELVGVRYKVRDSSGKVQVEGKAEMKKRGLASPNLADAFILTFASEAATAAGFSSGKKWAEPLKRNIKGIV